MALATRNLYLVLKARDEASRVVRGFGRELSRAGQLAQAENLRNQAALAKQKAVYLQSVGAAKVDVEAQKQLAAQLTAQAQALERAHRQAVRFSNALQTVASTVITMGAGMMLAGGAVGAFLVDATKAAIDYERQVKQTATQVTGFTADLGALSKIGLDVAKNIAVPFQEIQPALYYIFSSTSATLSQATVMLEAFAKTAVAGQVSIQDAASGTIPILNAFNIPLEDVNRILDIQFQLVRMGVGTYADFSAVYGRVVPSATRAGQSFEEVAAMLAYLTRNGLSAAMASSSAARALDALSNPVAVTNMENLGIAVRDSAGNMLPLEQILSHLRDYLNSIPNPDRVGKLVEIFKGAGGTIQARRFLDQILLRPGELEEFMGYLNDMKDSSGAFQDAYDTMADTAASRTQLLANKWMVLKITIGNILMPILNVLVGWLNKILDWFNNMDPSMQKVIVVILAVASAFGILAGFVLVIIGLLAGLAAAIVSAGSGFFILMGAILGVVVALGTAAAAVGTAWAKSEQFRDSIKELYHWFVALYEDVIVPFGRDVKAMFDRDVLPALRVLAAVVQTYILPALRELQHYIEGEAMKAIQDFAEFMKGGLAIAFHYAQIAIAFLVVVLRQAGQYYQEHKQTIDQVVGALIWLAKWVAIAAALFTGTLLIAIGAALIAAFVALGAVIAAVVEFVVETVDAVKDVVSWFGKWNEHMDGVKDNAKALGEAIGTHFVNIRNTITDSVKDFGSMLIHAGEELLNGLIQGIKNKLSAVGDAMKDVAGYIAGFFPHSPAKWGPLSGQGSMVIAGQNLVRQVAQGINSMQGMLTMPGATMAGAAGQAVLGGPATYGTGPTNQTFNITTQEINPTRHAAELGFLLGGRSS